MKNTIQTDTYKKNKSSYLFLYDSIKNSETQTNNKPFKNYWRCNYKKNPKKLVGIHFCINLI